MFGLRQLDSKMFHSVSKEIMVFVMKPKANGVHAEKLDMSISTEHKSRRHKGTSYIYVTEETSKAPVRLQTPRIALGEIVDERTWLHDDTGVLAGMVNTVEDALVDVIGPTDLTLERTQFPLDLKMQGVCLFESSTKEPVDIEESITGKPASLIIQLEGLKVSRPQGVAKTVWKVEQAMLYPVPKVNPFGDSYAFLEDEEYDSLED